MALRNWLKNVRKKLMIRKKLYKREKKKPRKTEKKKPSKITKAGEKKVSKTEKKETLKEAKKKTFSITTLYKKGRISSKINVKDVHLIDGMDVKDLKRRYSVKGSKCKILEAMVADYKQGRLSLPGLSHKSKFDEKHLDRNRLHQILGDYDSARKKRNIQDLEIIQNNVEQLKKKFKLTPSRIKVLEKMVNDLRKANPSQFEMAKSQLNPKILDQNKVNNLLAQYEVGQKQNRGISFLLTKSKLSFLASKRKFSAFLGELQHLDLPDDYSYDY